jgi:hypothetical protein
MFEDVGKAFVIGQEYYTIAVCGQSTFLNLRNDSIIIRLCYLTLPTRNWNEGNFGLLQQLYHALVPKITVFTLSLAILLDKYAIASRIRALPK